MWLEPWGLEHLDQSPVLAQSALCCAKLHYKMESATYTLSVSYSSFPTPCSFSPSLPCPPYPAGKRGQGTFPLPLLGHSSGCHFITFSGSLILSAVPVPGPCSVVLAPCTLSSASFGSVGYSFLLLLLSLWYMPPTWDPLTRGPHLRKSPFIPSPEMT